MAPYRVRVVRENHTDSTLGQELTISYGYNSTTFTDVEGRKNYYTFNYAGNTISIQDSSGFAQQYRYGQKDIFGKEEHKSKLSLESKLQRSVMNYLKNHSAETLSDWTLEATGGSSGTGNRSTLDKLYGNNSIRVNKTNLLGRHALRQTVTLERGKTYTLSSYVKTENVSTNGKGAYLAFYYQDSAGVWRNVDSAYIVGTTGWTRHEVTFALPSDALSNDIQVHTGILEATGTAYFDALQLEDGISASRYNLLENPDFRYGGTTPESWLKNSHTDTTDSALSVGAATHPAGLDTRAFRITGLANKQKNLYQTLYVSGKAGDTFVAAGWGKASSVPLADHSTRRFGLDVRLVRADGSFERHYIPFNADADKWQYASGVIKAERDYTEIWFYACYYNNANNADFDSMQLYKEEFGESYAYDTKGNLKTVESIAGQKQQFEFNGQNDLMKSINPKGGEFSYVYDTARNVTKATSAENVVYNFKWEAGNVTEASVGSDALKILTIAKPLANGNYTEQITDPSGNTVIYGWELLSGLLKTFTDAKNINTSYEYDAMGRLTKATKDGIEYSYTYHNDRLETISHNGILYTFEYDSLGNNTGVRVGNQSLITNTYQPRTSRLMESTYGNEHKVVYGYDTMGRVSTLTHGTVVTYRYHYNASGNIAILEDLLNSISYRYVYDLADRLVRVVDSNGNITSYGYDGNNNTSVFAEKLNGISSPNMAKGRPAVASSTQSASFPESNATDENLSTRWSSQYSDPQWIYVDLGVTKAIDRVVLRCEGAYGKAYEIQVSDDKETWTRIYNTTNGIGGVDDIRNLSGSGRYVRMYGTQRGTSFGYSLFEFEVYGPVSTSYAFDKDNRQTKVTLNTGGAIDYAYDVLGRLDRTTLNTTAPHTTSYTYQDRTTPGLTTNLLSSITNSGISGTATIRYSYDANGNIETIDNGQLIRYFYDNLNQLKRENNEVLGKTITYDYDSGGNIDLPPAPSPQD